MVRPSGALERAARLLEFNHQLRTYRTLRTNALSNTSERAETKTERFELRLSGELLARIDQWRRDQTDLPTRSEAIRRLVEMGLKPE